MIPVLPYWRSSRRFAQFDSRTGRWTVRWSAPTEPLQQWGWAFRYKQKWYAVWDEGGDKVFFADGQKWVQGRGVEFGNVLDGTAHTFSIRDRGELILEVKYQSHRDRLVNQIDPTYDGVDEELDDFFLMASRVLRR